MQYCISNGTNSSGQGGQAEPDTPGPFGRFLQEVEAAPYTDEFVGVEYVQMATTLLSLVGCVFVIISYVLFPPLRRYHSSFIIWIALMGMLYHGSVLAQARPYGECCVSAPITQISLLGQEVYFFVLAFDFYYTTKYPFLSTRFLRPVYHLAVWMLTTTTAYIGAKNTYGAINSYGFCWFGHFTTSGSDDTMFFTFTLPLVVGYSVCLGWYLLATKRLRLGAGGLHTKDGNTNLDTMRNYLVWSVCYWLVVLVPWTFRHKRWVTFNTPEEKVLRFIGRMLMSTKGLLTAIAWGRIMNISGAYNVWKKGSWDDYLKVHEAPWVLRRQILYFATKGIQYSASLAAEQHDVNLDSQRAGSSVSRGSTAFPRQFRLDDCPEGGPGVISYELEGPTTTSKAIFRDFHPNSFQEIRRLSGISSDSYIMSFSGRTKERFSEGKSGSFLYYTGDQLFILKTCTRAEQRYLLQILPQYMNHIRDNPNSYLCRYVGCHELVMDHHSVSFIVLTNILNNTTMNVDEFYDLKGSWVGRFRALTCKGTKRVCKYCGRDFIVGMSNEGCERHPVYGRGHAELITGKDLNWGNRRLRLPEELVQQLGSQLYADSEFLRRINSMDYSLIIGMSRYTSFTVTCSDDAGAAGFDLKYPSEKSLQGSSAEVDMLGQPSYFDTTYAQAASPVPSRSRDVFSSEACVVNMGIIDILTPWSLRKSIEHWMRVYLQCRDASGVSCINPTMYAERFRQNVVDVVIFGHGRRKDRGFFRDPHSKDFIMVDFANTHTGTPILL